MKISLCLIVWNELQGCKIDVPKLLTLQNQFEEIYAIDGGSSDGTVEYLESQGIKVYPQIKRGLNAAYIQANEVSSSDAVVVFFPKGTIPCEDILKFRPLFEDGIELIIASRQINGSVNEEDSKILRPRKWAVFLLAVLAAIVWKKEGNFIKDVLHGFKGWKCSSFNQMKILDYGLSIDIEMVVRSYKFKMKRVEFPTSEIPRHYGDTHFKIWPTGKKLLSYLLFELKRND